MRQRPRRNRRAPFHREVAAETDLGPARFVQPLFVHAGSGDRPIDALPGRSRLDLDGLVRTAERLLAVGVGAVALFPAVDESLKTRDAAECLRPDGLVPRAVQALKERFPELVVVTDVALDPYSSDGHDGLVADDGRVLNDETLEILAAQALMHARAGADVVAPSDMMDGRVAAIRDELDGAGFTDVSILAYTAKYASAYYGPFRAALDSAPRAGDKKTYQMDPRNRREALIEARLDEAEGADVLMVKPAGAYLDVIAELRAATSLPIAAYQVSGEYAMLAAAIGRGWLDERAAVTESLIAIRRAGADLILTYWAEKAAGWFGPAAG
ncbi:porphobilinogen synthase [Planctomycetes bacterium Pla163]|uniref:porphobilinogen synthase n=1 Tax=Rohdeia mirabilis TaxID=2528008 RepID=UPI0011A6937E